MAGILAVTDGPTGVRNSIIELCRRLVVAGHAVTLAGEPTARQLAEHHGLSFRALEPNGLEEFHLGDAAGGFVDRLRRLQERRRAAAASTGIEHFAELLDGLDPDLTLIDGEMHEQIIAIAATGVPMALLNTFCSIWRRSGSPPPHTAIRPGVGWSGSRTGIALAWTAFLLRKRTRRLRLRLRHVGCDRISVLRALGRGAGFDLDHEVDPGQWLIPFTYPGFPVLSLHALEFEFPHEPAPGVRYVGPMVLEDRLDPPMSDAERRRLDTLLDRDRRSDPGRAMLFAGFGSFFTANRRWVRRLVDSVGRRPGWDLVLALGHGADRDELGELPTNVHVFAWAPQLEVLAHANAAIVHGGINTIDECVLAGVPMLVACGGETDMAGNTARVVHHGIGLAADPDRDTPSRILGRLDRLLGDSIFADNLEGMRRTYRSYAHEKVAERTVDDLLAGAGTTTP